MRFHTGRRSPAARLALPLLLAALIGTGCLPAEAPRLPASSAGSPSASIPAPTSSLLPTSVPTSPGGAVQATTSATPSGTPAAPESVRFDGPRTLLELPPWAGSDCRISPDGRWVSYSELATGMADGAVQHGDLIAREVDTGGTVILVEGGRAAVYRHVWLPDSSGVLAITGPGPEAEILMKKVGPEPVVALLKAQPGSHGFEELAASSDGTRIAVTVMHDASPAPVPAIGIEVVDIAGGNRRQVVEPAYFVGDLQWSPDGRRVVYFKGKGGTPPDDGESYVVDAGGGSEPQELLPRARLIGWSPDGRSALWESFPMDPQGNVDLYVTGWPGLGATEPQVGVASGSGATWLGESGQVAYARAGAVYLIEPTGGESRRLTPEGEWSEAPLWLPDRGLAYRAGSGAPGSIRLLPIQQTG